LFELYQLPEFSPLQALSISQERITAAAFNANGDWLALGCARLGQLLVWEWASEGYVLRQQGHFFDVGCAAYSPDGALIATGADDAKVSELVVAAVTCTCRRVCARRGCVAEQAATDRAGWGSVGFALGVYCCS
jgi:periodic tryptophan protein 2